MIYFFTSFFETFNELNVWFSVRYYRNILFKVLKVTNVFLYDRLIARSVIQLKNTGNIFKIWTLGKQEKCRHITASSNTIRTFLYYKVAYPAY